MSDGEGFTWWKLIVVIIVAILACAGTVTANYFSQLWVAENAEQLRKRAALDAEKVRWREIRERAYCKLMGFKAPFVQAQKNYYEGMIQSEFHAAKLKMIVTNAFDKEQFVQENRYARSLIPKISEIHREIFEIFGNIRISFEMTEVLKTEMEAIYNFKAMNVPSFKSSPKVNKSEPKGVGNGLIVVESKLKAWKSAGLKNVDDYLQKEFTDRIERIIKELKRQIDTEG